jgi:sodium-independent sulfate anion transporter 11
MGLQILYVIRIFCGIFKTCIIAKGKKIDASQEMIAIGASNIMGSFASSFPITGSFSRTSVNAASGVRTPFNGIYTGIFLFKC